MRGQRSDCPLTHYALDVILRCMTSKEKDYSTAVPNNNLFTFEKSIKKDRWMHHL